MWSMCRRPTGRATVSGSVDRPEARQERAAVVARARRTCGWCRRRWRWRPRAPRRHRPSAARGSRTLRAPRCVVSRHACSASSTHSAMSRTPSPCTPHVLGNGMIRRQRGGQDEADLALLQHVGGAVARARLRTAVGRQPHAQGGAVEVGRLLGVAHLELDVVGAVQRQESPRSTSGASVRCLHRLLLIASTHSAGCPSSRAGRDAHAVRQTEGPQRTHDHALPQAGPPPRPRPPSRSETPP